jgi:crossover junction endodeoxyribonuclease RusA
MWPPTKQSKMLTLTLPYPPSINTYYRHPSSGPLAGRHLISQQGRNYQRDVAILSRRELRPPHLPAHGKMAVDITLSPPDKRKRDIDNPIKPLLDALTRAGIWKDDSQVSDLHVRWGHAGTPGPATITITLHSESNEKPSRRNRTMAD